MKIYFSQKYLGKDTSELDSSYLVWILEQYQGCDVPLREACQKELSERLSLDFSPKSSEQMDVELALKMSIKQCEKLIKERDDLQNLIVMSYFVKGNRTILQMYANNPTLMNQDLKLIKEANEL